MVIDAARDIRDEVSEVATPLDHLSVEEGESAVQWVIDLLRDHRRIAAA
jgi:hypothetical protein